MHGQGGVIPVKSAQLHLGNAGTALRPLTAVLALAGGHYEIAGVARMHERPIGDLVDALRALGADIRYLRNAGFPPLAIAPGRVRAAEAPDRVTIRGEISSQFTSALLMALPILTAGGVRALDVDVAGALISQPYVAITTHLMDRFGVGVEQDGWRSFRVPAGARYASPGAIKVEGDASSASYFLAAGAIGGGPVRVTGVGRDSIQGDVAFADALARMGAVIDGGDDWIEARAGPRLAGIRIDCTPIPDAAMTLAVVALFAKGPTTLTGIASWRVKETDRIAAMAAELGKLGAAIETGDDHLTVSPPERLTPATIRTYDDHRIAMCFALAALGGIARAHRRSGLRAQDVSRLLRGAARRRKDMSNASTSVPVIAVDGPAASGKGTIAAGVAQALGFHLLDSGSLYRLVALKALESGIARENGAALASAAADLDVAFSDDRIRLDGRDVTDRIRAEDVGAAASQVAVHPAVRTALLDRQRAFRQPPGLVADGRDMGTVVFPDARLKVFLTASPEERAGRRHKQLIEKGIPITIESLLRDIRERDARDAERTVAPLAPAADALVLDTTGISIAAAVRFVLDRYPASGSGRADRAAGKQVR